MDNLLQRVEGQQADSALDGLAGRPDLALVGEQPGEGLQRQLTQPLPLRDQPFLEQRLAHAEARQQIARVECGGLLEGLGRALGHVPLKRGDVHIHHDRVQGERLAC